MFPRFSDRCNAIAAAFVFCLSCVGSIAWAVDDDETLVATSAVQPASNEGEQAMGTFKVRDDWQIELVAAEPEVANVVAMDIDADGNLYVAETFRQTEGVTDNRSHDQRWLEADLAAQTVQDRIDYFKRLLGDGAVAYTQNEDRIRKLSDTDGDGKMDRSVVLADGFNKLEEGTGAGVLAVGDSVYYTCIPKLWKLIDADGDGVAENRVVLSDGYGVRVAFRGHDSHGLIVGPDGRLYFSIGDRGYYITGESGETLADPASGAVFRCEMDGSDLTVVATGMRNPQELAFNDVGDLFSVDNNSDSGDEARIIQILPGGDTGWRMHYQYLPDRGVFNREKIWEPLHEDQTVAIVPPIANFTDGPSGLAFYPGTGFGDTLKNKFLICDFRGGSANSGVRSFELQPDGAFYKQIDDAQPIWQILATDVMFGPRGGIFVSDWVDGWNGLGKARVYRLTAKDRDDAIVDETHRMLTIAAAELSNEQLIEGLSHADRRVRQRMQFELASRDDIAGLREVAANTDGNRLARLHAMWAMGQIARRDQGLRADVARELTNLVADQDDEVARNAMLLAGDLDLRSLATAIASVSTEERPRVQYAVWMALAKLNSDAATDSVAGRLASIGNSDPALRHAAIYYWSEVAPPEQLLEVASDQESFVRRCVVAALRRSDPPSLKRFLSDADPMVVAEAVRGIHDDGSKVLSAELIAMASSPDIGKQNEETIRRLINTSDRTRSKAAAEALIAVAGNQSLDNALRVAAIEQLSQWTQPRTIDVYDHTHRPRPPADGEMLVSVLRPALKPLTAVAGPIKRAAIDAAAEIGLAEIAPELNQIVQDSEESNQDRAGALVALSRLQPKAADDLAQKLATNPTPALAIAALKVLSKNIDGNIESFVAATESSDVRVRQMGWDAIAKSDTELATERLKTAAEQLLQDELDPTVQLNVVEAIEQNAKRLPTEMVANVTDKVAEIYAASPTSGYQTSLAGGDVDAGKKLFMENTKLSCVRCHRVDRAGGAVGPVLTVIGAEKTPQYLLESICYPDAAIAKGYETTIVATDSGEVFAGIVAADEDEFLTLTLNDGSRKRLYQDEIIARKPGKSSMPGDLMKHMTRRDLRDLVAYLSSLKVDPRAASDVE